MKNNFFFIVFVVVVDFFFFKRKKRYVTKILSKNFDLFIFSFSGDWVFNR